MRGNVERQGLGLQWGHGWLFPLCRLVPPVSTPIAAAFGLLPGWEYSLLLAMCPLCHLWVIWVARHHLMHDEGLGRCRHPSRDTEVISTLYGLGKSLQPRVECIMVGYHGLRSGKVSEAKS
jgi:hypothetical protein